MKLLKLSEETEDARMWSVKDALKDAEKTFDDPDLEESHKKVLVLLVSTQNETFTVNYIQAGMSSSQCLAVLEVAKTSFLKDMGYL